MLLGTWGAAYFTYCYGPWVGVLGAAAFGRARRPAARRWPRSPSASTTSSPASRSTSSRLGATQFLAEAYFSDLENGGPRQLTGLDPLPYVTIPASPTR